MHKCFLAFSHQYLTKLFPKPPNIFPHALAEVRGENAPERNFASTHDHQVMNPTRSPLSDPEGPQNFKTMADLHVQMSMFLILFFFNLICCIQLCDKKNLTIVDCCNKVLLNSS